VTEKTILGHAQIARLKDRTVDTSGERNLRTLVVVVAVSVAFCLSACGMYVPELQDIATGYTDSTPFVNDVVYNVTCEVRNAVHDLYADYAGRDEISFLDNWGAQIDLTLTVNENSSVAPATQFFPIGQPKNWMFNWGVNANVNPSATRTDTVSYFYSISELKNSPPCIWRPNGPMLLETDLKFKEWLYDAVGVKITGAASLPAGAAPAGGAASAPSGASGGTKPTNVLTHTVTFVLTTSGGVTPQWALRNASFIHVPVNLGRMRTNTMLVTLGPTAQAPTKDGKKGTTLQLAPTALNKALAQNIATAITNTLNNCGLLSTTGSPTC
jgi:hypothetical protein